MIPIFAVTISLSSMQDTEYLIKTLTQIIDRDIRHENYTRVNELCNDYTALITGEKTLMQPLMRRFDRHESLEAFEQRVSITSHITQSVARNLMKPLYKIPRSNSVNRIVAYKEDKNGEKAKELEEILSKFWGDASLDSWFNQRWIDLAGSDPNAWCVLEWKDFNPKEQKAQPYPFEVSSKDAIHFLRDNSNELQFLVAKQTLKDDFDHDEREKFTIYGKDETVAFTALTMDEEKVVHKNKIQEGVLTGYVIGDKDVILIKTQSNKLFTVTIFRHELNLVPAFVVGFNRDIYTKGKTFLSVIDDSVPILMKMVKANSEMDLTAALHVFPQKIQYANRCESTGCSNGYLPDGKTCKTCGGTGYQVHKTAQDIIYLRMPKDKDDFLNLDNIIKYVTPAVELVQWQDRYIEKLTERAKEAMFNSDLFSRKQVAETATGKNIDLQSVYDSLFAMASAYSVRWKFAVHSIAKITDMDKGLIAAYSFSKDFKLKSLTDLYNDMKTISDSDADSFVKDAIQDDIARIVWADDQINYNKYLTERAFYPFSGKSEKEILFALSTDLVPLETKVLYINFGNIMDELFLESLENIKDVNFFEMAKDEQKKLIDSKVKEIMSKIKKDNPVFKDVEEG
jgi:hypothetical protein